MSEAVEEQDWREAYLKRKSDLEETSLCDWFRVTICCSVDEGQR